VTINRWSNGLDDVHCNTRPLRILADFFLIFIGQINNIFITESLEVINFNVGLEDGESMAYIGEVVKSVNVYTSYFNFITRTSCVN
tara:strand:- start:134 stop:391 length:258 start_codon:yes stop_codon:yes gene_type:complete